MRLQTETRRTSNLSRAAYHVFIRRGLKAFCRTLTLDRNSHSARVDVCVETFLQPALQSACQCWPSISSNLPPLRSAVNKHFMGHRLGVGGGRDLVTTFHSGHLLFWRRRRRECTRRRDSLASIFGSASALFSSLCHRSLFH